MSFFEQLTVLFRIIAHIPFDLIVMFYVCPVVRA